MPRLPSARGPLSELLVERLVGPPGPLPAVRVPAVTDPLGDEDLHLALYLAYELHYRGWDGVDPAWEWQPSLLALRAELEAVWEGALRARVPVPDAPAPEDMDLALRAIEDAAGGPSVSRPREREGTREQLEEFLVHRSAYNLKEADPHSWAIPRLAGRAKAALVEIQVDEYGGGDPAKVHATLYADTLAAVGLDPAYGAYIDAIPGFSLAIVNLMSLFGLHRRLRGAIVGHLALFEISSAIPSRRYATGMRRLGLGKPATHFFDEHVEADAVHEAIAGVDLAGGLARAEPELTGQILWGAACLTEVEGGWAARVLAAWEAGASSLRTPLAVTA
jgi:Iron-containing redox enzyme